MSESFTKKSVYQESRINWTVMYVLMYEKVALSLRVAPELNASILDYVFLTWSLPTNSRRFCGQIYNANGRRTADMQQRTKWTLTFSSTWRFRVDTCKSLASTYIYCVFVNQVCTMKIFLLFSSSTTVNNSYYYTGFPTCCE